MVGEENIHTHTHKHNTHATRGTTKNNAHTHTHTHHHHHYPPHPPPPGGPGVGARDVSGLPGRRRWRGPRRQREHGPLSLSTGSHDAAACHCQGPALLAGRERAAAAR